MGHKITNKQLLPWVAAAMSAPLAHYAGLGWLAVGLATGAMLPLTLLFARGWQNMGKFVSLTQLVWIIVVTGALIQESGAYWPGAGSSVAVPLALLMLAALTGSGQRGARVGSVLFWALILLYLPVLFAGTAQIEPEWLEPYQADWKAGLLITLLLPGLTGVWTEDRQGKVKGILGTGALAVVLAALAQGVLSGVTALRVEAPYYEIGRTLRLGTFSRWEPAVSVAVTMGWYALCAFLVRTGCRFGIKCGIPEKYCSWLIALSAAGIVVFHVQQNGAFLTAGSLFLWVLVPMLHEKILPKKIEKSA